MMKAGKKMFSSSKFDQNALQKTWLQRDSFSEGVRGVYLDRNFNHRDILLRKRA
jgi:hypothetical protein